MTAEQRQIDRHARLIVSDELGHARGQITSVYLGTGEWIDEHGLTWLAVAPKIKLLPDTAKREPYAGSAPGQLARFGIA